MKRTILAALAAATLTAGPATASAGEHHQIWLGLRETHTLVCDGGAIAFSFRGRWLHSGECVVAPQARLAPRATGERTVLRPGDTFHVEAGSQFAPRDCRDRGHLDVRGKGKSGSVVVVKCAKGDGRS